MVRDGRTVDAVMLMCWTLPDAVGSEVNETDTKATCLLREIVVKQVKTQI